MVNLYDYFAVNWDATADNIKSLMTSRASNKVLAKFIGVTEKTIRNWYNGKSKPNFNNLVLIAKICDVDIFEILVLNGQTGDAISIQDVEECKEKENQVDDNNKIKEKDEDLDFQNEEMIVNEIIFNEFLKRNYPVTNLDEFLFMLPLVNMKKLCDMLYRINGNIGTNKNYVLEQLKRLYDNIPNDKAKEFVEYHKEYYLTYPSIASVTDFTTMDLKLKKFEDGISIYKSEAYREMYKSYQEKYDAFLELLLLASGKKKFY